MGGMEKSRGFALRAVAVAAAILIVLVMGTPAPRALAQSILAGGFIEDIRVEGTQRIEDNSVRSYMNIKSGDPFDPVRLDQSLKAIYATGLFADVTLRRENNILIVAVVENPIINRIAFEGNKRIEDEALLAEIQLRPRLVFTRTKVQRDAQRVLEVYRRSGRFAATVDPKVIQLDQNRVDLVFEVTEGPLTTIDGIHFIGNSVFSDGRLSGVVTTSEHGIFSFLSTTDTYDPDRLTFDRELLRRFYLAEGYADFKVISVVAELTESRQGFIVTFTVEEGERYKFGAIDVSTSLRNLDTDTLGEELSIVEGDWYDAGLVDETIDLLSQKVGDLGFAFVEIRPKVEKDSETRVIALTFEISEGPKVYVERIDIEGNIRTLDRVVRREMLLVEGDAFNTTRLRRSRQRIQNLGFFRVAEVETEPGSLPDRTVIKVKVEDQSTGDFSFGFGFSSSQGPIGNIGVRERNLLGRGQDARVSLNVAGSATELDLSFTEPYFLDRNVAAGFDAFRTRVERDESSFDLERIGGSLRAGYNLSEDLRHVVRYTAEYRDISDVGNADSLIIQAEEGSNIRSVIGNELRLDKRDNRFDPRKGYQVAFGADFSGVGGDVRFIKSTLEGAYHYTFLDDVTITTKGELGGLVGLGEDTSVVDRFFRGGGTPRGFEFGGIGPRDATTNDALGGKYLYSGTVEMSVPIDVADEFDIRGRLFTDVVAVWAADDLGTGAPINSSASPRLVVGAGISWNSPFGPIIVDLGFPLVKESFDEKEILSFSFGTQF